MDAIDTIKLALVRPLNKHIIITAGSYYGGFLEISHRSKFDLRPTEAYFPTELIRGLK